MTHDPSSPSHSTALPTVRVVPLRWWLPLALVFTCVLAFALLVLQQQRHYTLDLQRFSDRTAHAELLGTQRNLETVLRREDGSGLDGVIAELGLNPAVAHALLLDASDEVLAATRFAWRGSLGTQVLPHYPQDLVSKARQEQREQLRLDIEQRHLWAVTPVMLALEAGAIRSSRQGVLLVEYDLTPIAVQSSAHIRQQAQVFAAVVLLAALCLRALARVISRRCQRCVARASFKNWARPWGTWRKSCSTAAKHCARAKRVFASFPTWRLRPFFCIRGATLWTPTLQPSV